MLVKCASTSEVFCCSKTDNVTKKCVEEKILKSFSFIPERDTAWREKEKRVSHSHCDDQRRTRQFVKANSWYLVMQKRLQFRTASAFLHNSSVRVCMKKLDLDPPWAAIRSQHYEYQVVIKSSSKWEKKFTRKPAISYHP